MNIEVLKSFEKDILRVHDKELAAKAMALIEQLENIQRLSEIQHLEKMAGRGNFYRVRVGDYRVGLKIEKQTITLIRFMNRKDIYKYFP